MDCSKYGSLLQDMGNNGYAQAQFHTNFGTAIIFFLIAVICVVIIVLSVLQVKQYEDKIVIIVIAALLLFCMLLLSGFNFYDAWNGYYYPEHTFDKQIMSFLMHC